MVKEVFLVFLVFLLATILKKTVDGQFFTAGFYCAGLIFDRRASIDIITREQ